MARGEVAWRGRDRPLRGGPGSVGLWRPNQNRCVGLRRLGYGGSSRLLIARRIVEEKVGTETAEIRAASRHHPSLEFSGREVMESRVVPGWRDLHQLRET